MFKRISYATVLTLMVQALLTWGLEAQAPLRPAVTEATAEQLAAEKRLKTCTAKTNPEEVYNAFNAFCTAHFGAEKEPLVYKLFGDKLEHIKGGDWVHASETSACIAWETNLPALTHVEYGETAAYGHKTSEPERPFYIHVHYLRSLKPETTYHYRLVSVDERGNHLASEDRTLKTGRPEGAVSVPGDLQGPPYVLDKAGATYILTKDITTAGTAFEVKADGITIDLGGNTVVFAQGGPPESSGITRTARETPNLKILNGTVRQGMSPRMAEDKHCTSRRGRGPAKNAYKFKNIHVAGANIEIAGVTVDYHAPQVWGVYISRPSGKINVHHNVFEDRGTAITSRHGSAVRSMGFQGAKREANAYRIHHNLVKRTRQNGLSGASEISHNEIYVDSWSTNSFAIQTLSIPDVPAGDYQYNRIFTTGFNPYGFGWAHKDLMIHHNLVHMQGIDVKSRWGERWGDVNMSAAMRVTNYGKGGQKRENLQYWNNLIVLKGREGCELRGVEFFSDETIKDLVFHGNTVKVEVQDDKTRWAACVDTQGQAWTADTCLPVVYRNNELISNLYHVRFGDSYGVGSNHHFVRCRFIRTGDDKRYHTFRFRRGYSRRHEIVDCEFGPGTAYNDVVWGGTSVTSWYKVRWTLTVRTAAGAKVTVTDKDGQEVFSGVADEKGTVSKVLTQCVVHPVEWRPGMTADGKKLRAKDNNRHKEVLQTPHTVTVEVNGRKATRIVTMDHTQTVDLKP